MYDHFKGNHFVLSVKFKAPQALSDEQERVLLDQTAPHAERDAHLIPSHIYELAKALAGGKLGIKWVSRFVDRFRDVIHSHFFAFHEGYSAPSGYLRDEAFNHGLKRLDAF